MELWIRSQDKEVLSKVNNLCYYTREDVLEFIKEEELKKDIQHIIWSPDGSILGYYKTKERALEILDEIQNLLNPMLVFKNCNCTQEMLENIKEIGACVVSDNTHIEQVQTCIYEMPKE